MKMKIIIVGIFLAFALFSAGYLPNRVHAFSSVLGASKIAPDAQLYIDGTLVENPEEVISAKTNKPTFFGYTFENVKVEFTVSSEPITGQTTSDRTGYWVKQLDTQLEPGIHTISLNLTDASGASTSAFLAGTFRVPEVLGANTQINTKPPLNQLNYLTITLIVAGVAFILAFFYLILRRLHQAE